MGVPSRVSWGVAWLIDSGGLVGVNADILDWVDLKVDSRGGCDEHSDGNGFEHFGINIKLY